MKYAIVKDGKINLVKCTPEFAKQCKYVIEVDDDVGTGWNYKDGNIIKPKDDGQKQEDLPVSPISIMSDSDLEAIAAKALKSSSNMAKAFKLLCSRSMLKSEFESLKNDIIGA